MKIHDSNSGTFLSMIQFYICHDSRDFLKTAIENCIKTAGLYKSKNTITGELPPLDVRGEYDDNSRCEVHDRF